MGIDKEEIIISREAGFSGLWIVDGGYEIKDGILRGSGMPQKEYAPMAHRELPSEISKLKENDENGLIEFATVYGPFGYWAFKDRVKGTGGDPVNWIWTHANTIKIILTMLSALKHEDEIEAQQLIKKYLLKSKESPPSLTVGIQGRIETKYFFHTDSSTDTPGLILLNQVVSAIINDNVKGIYRKAYKTGEYSMKSFFSFSALVEIAYWQLLDAVEGGEFRRCALKTCNHPFIQTDKRQRFCPKRPGEEESRCALLYRQREYQKKGGKNGFKQK